MTPYQLTFAINLGPSQAGQLLTARLFYQNGTPVGPPISTGFTDLGDGTFSWLGTIPDVNFSGTVKFMAADGVVADADINPYQSNANQQIHGTGSVLVDHDYGGKDNLAVQTCQGVRMEGVTIRVYRKEDYDTGNRGSEFVIASTTTDSNGRWREPLFLDPNTYTLLLFKQNVIKSKIVNLKVT